MGIPMAKDYVTISRVLTSDITDDYDPDPPRPAQLAKRVRAVITTPSAAPNLVGGDRIAYNATMTCDPTDLEANDKVLDANGTEWRCLTVVAQKGFGFNHMVVTLRLVTGAAS